MVASSDDACVKQNLSELSFVPPSKFAEKVPKPNLKGDKLEMQRSQAEYDDLVEIINILMKVPSLRDGVKRHAIELHGAWVTAQIAQGFEQVDTSSSLAAVDEIWALGYLSQKLKCDAAALSKAQKIDKGAFCHLLMFLANASAGLKLPEQSKYSFVLTYAFDKRIDECKRLDLLHRKK
jgi:hypothetical protein